MGIQLEAMQQNASFYFLSFLPCVISSVVWLLRDMLKIRSFKVGKRGGWGRQNRMKERRVSERGQIKQGLLYPERLKQNRETEGLCFLFLNGVERRGRQRRVTVVPISGTVSRTALSIVL